RAVAATPRRLLLVVARADRQPDAALRVDADAARVALPLPHIGAEVGRRGGRGVEARYHRRRGGRDLDDAHLVLAGVELVQGVVHLRDAVIPAVAREDARIAVISA